MLNLLCEQDELMIFSVNTQIFFLSFEWNTEVSRIRFTPRMKQFPRSYKSGYSSSYCQVFIWVYGPSEQKFAAAVVLTVESLRSLAVELPCERGWCPPTVANLQSEQTIHVRELLKLRATHISAGGGNAACYLRIISSVPIDYPHSRCKYTQEWVARKKENKCSVILLTLVVCERQKNAATRQQNACKTLGIGSHAESSTLTFDVHAKVLVQRARVSSA
jgi:hypothetical protein